MIFLEKSLLFSSTDNSDVVLWNDIRDVGVANGWVGVDVAVVGFGVAAASPLVIRYCEEKGIHEGSAFRKTNIERPSVPVPTDDIRCNLSRFLLRKLFFFATSLACPIADMVEFVLRISCCMDWLSSSIDKMLCCVSMDKISSDMDASCELNDKQLDIFIPVPGDVLANAIDA